MSNDFFDKFGEDTNVKLELYIEYLKEWFLVFIAAVLSLSTIILNKPFPY